MDKYWQHVVHKYKTKHTHVFAKGHFDIFKSVPHETTQVVFGVTQIYKTCIYNIKYMVYRYYYELVYPVGIE